MAAIGFDDFVRREQEVLKDAGMWYAEKDEWLRRLDELYEQAASYLKPYIDEGQISVTFAQVELEEEIVGRYLAKKMVVDIGTKRVELLPAGTFLIGSKGRVDVTGPVGRALILLVNSSWKSLTEAIRVNVSIDGGLPPSQIENNSGELTWSWRIVTRPPGGLVIEINKENFLNLLVEVSNGKNL